MSEVGTATRRTRVVETILFTCTVCTPVWELRRGRFTRKQDLLRLRAFQETKVRLGKKRLQVFRSAVDDWLRLIGADTHDREYDSLTQAQLWLMSATTFRLKRSRVRRASELPLDYRAETVGAILAVCGKREILQLVDAEIADLAGERRRAEQAFLTVPLVRDLPKKPS